MKITTLTIEPDNGSGDPIQTFVFLDAEGAYRKLRELHPDVHADTDDDLVEQIRDKDIYPTIQEHDLVI